MGARGRFSAIFDAILAAIAVLCPSKYHRNYLENHLAIIPRPSGKSGINVVACHIYDTTIFNFYGVSRMGQWPVANYAKRITKGHPYVEH